MRKYIALSVVSLIALGPLTSELGAQTLAAALDTTGLAWTTGGDAIWAGQTGSTFDGIDAAESGTITHSQEAWMETTVTGPGTVSFWWKVTSQPEPDSDFLEFSISDVFQDAIFGGPLNWQYRSFDVPAGSQTLRWLFVRDDGFSNFPDKGWVDQVIYTTAPSIPLAQALDTSGYLWTGNTNPTYWSGQTNVTHDGVDAAESGAVYGTASSPQESWMETTVSGATNVSFWWKVSSRANNTFLEFYTNGVKKAAISGEVNWTSNSFAILNVSQTLRWRYVKSNSVPVGQDRGWVDQVVISPLTVSPAITNQPQSQTATAGTNVTFNVGATGSAPLSYQWRFNSNNLAGATSNTFTLMNVQATNAGNYSVVVSNAYGSAVSSNATLTVVFPPSITTPPSNQTALVNSTVTFSVEAGGTGPLSYQWRFNSNNLAGATSTALTLMNVQATNAGSYSVVVSNAYGSVVTSNSTLTVNPLPTLLIRHIDDSIVLSWPSVYGDFGLESTLSLTVLNWTNVTAAAVSNAQTISVALPPTNSQTFYRLKKKD